MGMPSGTAVYESMKRVWIGCFLLLSLASDLAPELFLRSMSIWVGLAVLQGPEVVLDVWILCTFRRMGRRVRLLARPIARASDWALVFAIPLLATLVQMASYTAYFSIRHLLTGSEPMFSSFVASSAPAILMLVLDVVSEELIFRGLTLHAFAARWNVSTAIILSALVFAAMHRYAPLLVNWTVLGMMLCVIYIRTGSILAPIISHLVINLIAEMLMPFLIGRYHVDLLFIHPLFGLACLVVAAPLISIFLLKNWPDGWQRLPLFADIDA